jgi:hypothetical protein
VKVFDAAVVGLAQVIPGPLSRALPYCYENKAKECVEAEEGPEESGVHESLLIGTGAGVDGLDDEKVRLAAVGAKDANSKIASSHHVVAIKGEVNLSADGAPKVERRHGSGLRSGLRTLRLGIALDDQFAQLEGRVSSSGDLSRLPAREPGLRDACATVDLALRQVVLLPKAHQKTEGFALLSAHKAQSYAMSPSNAMLNRIIFFCIVRV